MITTRLKVEAFRRGYGSEDLATIAGCSDSLVRKVWKGERTLDAHAAHAIADTLSVPFSDLFSGDDRVKAIEDRP